MSFQPMSMTEKQAPEMLSHQGDQNVQPLQFTKIDDYTTFQAEFAIDGEDLVFHFFLPPELAEANNPAFQQRVEKYWKDGFPRSLDVVARNFFKAEFPRLKAAYTQELKSWWLRANGFAAVLDPSARARAFIGELDHALDALSVSARGV